MVLALGCKTVFAVEVAGVSDVEAKSLYNAVCLGLKHCCFRLECIFGKELALLLESFNRLVDLGKIVLVYVCVNGSKLIDELVLAGCLKAFYKVVCYVIDNVDRT